MIATFISALLAALTVYLSLNQQLNPNLISPTIPLLAPILLLLSQAAIWALAFLPFQKAEQNLTPRVLQLVGRDAHLKLYCGGLVLTSFLALFVSFDYFFFNQTTPTAATALWLILIGLSFDFVFLTIKRIYDYLNPFKVVSFFTDAGKRSVENDQEIDLCHWIESMSEIGVKSLHRASSSLCLDSIEGIRDLLRIFLDSSKSIAHSNRDPQSMSAGITDKVSYTLFYILDRLKLIYHKALELQVEPVCSSIVTTLGKISVDAARCDLSLVRYPVLYIGEFCRKAEAKKMKDIPLKGSCTLVEASKAIINQTDLTYQDLIDPFTSIINQLNEMAKESFRQDKSIRLQILKEPLIDLKTLFQSEKLANHQDTPTVLKAIDQALAEWEILEGVMRTMPPIPTAPPSSNTES